MHEWLKLAILLYFRQSEMATIELGPFEYADKIPLKRDFQAAGVRVVPGASARFGSFLDRGAVMMPSYVNIGARVGANSMVDTWATVGSCAQIGANVHLGGGVGIGGVLEPPQAAPVIIEDDCMIFSRCIVVDGARVGRGIGARRRLHPVGHRSRSSTSRPARSSAEGDVPPWSRGRVGHPSAASSRAASSACRAWLVIKRLAEGERHDKAQLNSILRDHGVAQ